MEDWQKVPLRDRMASAGPGGVVRVTEEELRSFAHPQPDLGRKSIKIDLPNGEHKQIGVAVLNGRGEVLRSWAYEV